MRPILLFFLIMSAVSGIISCNSSDKTVPKETVVKSSHGDKLNRSFDAALISYKALTEAFVNWDSLQIIASADRFEKDLKQLSLEELTRDSAVVDSASKFLSSAYGDLKPITAENDIATKRHGLNAVTEDFFKLLNVIQYDEKKLYLQKCPMAFNDEEPGVWLSSVDSIRNPYFGLHHPRYGGAMIECGENKSTVDFISAANKKAAK